MQSKKCCFTIAESSIAGNNAINQDAVGWVVIGSNSISILCDGIGSLPDSEFCAKLIVKIFIREFKITNFLSIDIHKWFQSCIKKIYNVMFSNIKKYKLAEMGSTVCVLLTIGNNFFAFNLGDSRIYKSVNSRMRQISYDDNVYNFLKSKEPNLINTPKVSSQLASLTNSINSSYKLGQMSYNFCDGKIFQNDMFILCTDGLYNYVDLTSFPVENMKMDMNIFSKKLNTLALERKSHDNISNIIIKYYN